MQMTRWSCFGKEKERADPLLSDHSLPDIVHRFNIVQILIHRQLKSIFDFMKHCIFLHIGLDLCSGAFS